MPVYQYVALNNRGQEVRGRAEGADPRSVSSTLRAQSLFVVRLMQQGASAARGDRSLADAWLGVKRYFAGLWPVRTRDRVFFFQQMALMLRTGLTLLQALEVARDQTSKPRFVKTIDNLREGIQSGKSFSQAMLQERQFSTFTVKLIETAEASGELDRILEQIATYMERRAELRRKLLTGLTYPLIVVLASIGVAVFLVVVIIPKFKTFFERRQAKLPWSTQMLVDVSNVVTEHYVTALAIIATVIGSTIGLYMTDGGRRAIDRALLSVPVIGTLIATGSMVTLTQSVSMMLGSGVTLLESLRIAASVIANRSMSGAVQQAGEQILRGQDLARSLAQPVIPRLLTQVVAVGERTGSLAQVLGELNAFYDRQLQAYIQRLSSLIEPVMILIIGSMVGFVYFSFFQAVFELATAGR